MSSLATSSPVSAPPPPDLRLASRVLLFLGAAEIILFGLVTFAVTKASRMSIAELQQITGENLSLEQLQAVHPQLRYFAIALALCGVIPGAVFVLCSVGLRRGIAAAGIVALVLAATQFFVAGAVLLRQVLVGIGNGDPPAITMNVLTIGTPMAFLVFVIRCLFAARQSTNPKSTNLAPRD